MLLGSLVSCKKQRTCECISESKVTTKTVQSSFNGPAIVSISGPKSAGTSTSTTTYLDRNKKSDLCKSRTTKEVSKGTSQTWSLTINSEYTVKTEYECNLK